MSRQAAAAVLAAAIVPGIVLCTAPGCSERAVLPSPAGARATALDQREQTLRDQATDAAILAARAQVAADTAHRTGAASAAALADAAALANAEARALDEALRQTEQAAAQARTDSEAEAGRREERARLAEAARARAEDIRTCWWIGAAGAGAAGLALPVLAWFRAPVWPALALATCGLCVSAYAEVPAWAIITLAGSFLAVLAWLVWRERQATNTAAGEWKRYAEALPQAMREHLDADSLSRQPAQLRDRLDQALGA